MMYDLFLFYVLFEAFLAEKTYFGIKLFLTTIFYFCPWSSFSIISRKKMKVVFLLFTAVVYVDFYSST